MKAQTANPGAGPAPERMLALQLKRIGDLVVTTPALRTLRELWPQTRITLVVGESGADLADAIPAADDFWVCAPRDAGRVALALRRARAEICLDFTGNDRSAFLARASGARRRIAFARAGKSLLRRLAHTEWVDSAVGDRHTVDHYLDLLRPLAPPHLHEALDLRVPPEAEGRAERLLAAAGIAPPYLLAHPGSARPEKLWPAPAWAEALRHAQERFGLPLVFSGDGSREEARQIEEIRALVPGPTASLAGQLDLVTLAALVARARLFLGVDSAPMHFAAASDTPQVALFGPTNPFHWHPRRSSAIVVHAGHEGEPFAPRRSRHPMSEISTAAVCRAIDSQFHRLSAPGGGDRPDR